MAKYSSTKIVKKKKKFNQVMDFDTYKAYHSKLILKVESHVLSRIFIILSIVHMKNIIYIIE